MVSVARIVLPATVYPVYPESPCPEDCPDGGPEMFGFYSTQLDTEVSVWYSYQTNRDREDIPAGEQVARLCLRREAANGDYVAVQLSPNAIEIRKKVNGGQPVVRATASVVSEPKTWYSLRMRCAGTSARVWRRDDSGSWTLLCSTDSLSNTTSDGFVFDVDAGSTYWFDEFRIDRFAGDIAANVGAADTVSLTTAVTSGQGAIIPSGGSYPEDEEIFIRMEPDEETPVFDSWDGDDVGSVADPSSSSTRMTMNTSGPGGSSKSIESGAFALGIGCGCGCGTMVEVIVKVGGWPFMWADENKNRGTITTMPAGEAIDVDGWPGVRLMCKVGSTVKAMVEPGAHPTGAEYKFVEWLGPNSAAMCGEDEVVFTVTEPTTVTAVLLVGYAHFSCLNQLNSVSYGSISVSPGDGCTMQQYTEIIDIEEPMHMYAKTQHYEVWGPYGAVVKASATAGGDHRFDLWDGCDAKRTSTVRLPLYTCSEYNPIFVESDPPDTTNYVHISVNLMVATSWGLTQKAAYRVLISQPISSRFLT